MTSASVTTVEATGGVVGSAADGVRALAIHLPQFHPIPENDAWWGKGFTEWRNVVKAKPLFGWHEQPHLPADLGFYDLRLPEARAAQADLARAYGIHGFMYYHYWFSGKPLLERPVDEIVSSGEPDFPFCLCWANENWTRAWDGQEREVLLEQHYSPEDDVAHLRHLIPALSDRRYIRVDGKPLLAVYRANIMPEPRATAERWRREAERAGLGGLFLVAFEGHQDNYGDAGELYGFDARLQFAPAWTNQKNHGKRELGRGRRNRVRGWLGDASAKAYWEHRVMSYESYARACMSAPDPDYLRIPGLMVGFDNASRRKTGAMIYRGTTPERFAKWLEHETERAARNPGHARYVVINAWNEWAEGNHLEPDARWGRAYLEAVQRVMANRAAAGRGDG
ncbi:MAG: glycoside hydrolase family 99-like domain-containing protein [Planctomycetota bacterium]